MKNITNKRKYSSILNQRLNAVGKTIYQKRKELNYSRQKLSNELIFLDVDISTQAIYDIEIGKRTVLDYELCAIAKVLNISTDELLAEFRFRLDHV